MVCESGRDQDLDLSGGADCSHLGAEEWFTKDEPEWQSQERWWKSQAGIPEIRDKGFREVQLEQMTRNQSSH